MVTHSAPLVGAHFRPPAKALLQSLPSNHPLELIPEPTNPYDPNAVAVFLRSSTLSQDSLAELGETLPPMGCDVETLLATPLWHVGYMAKEHASRHQQEIGRILAAEMEEFGEGAFAARLNFSGDGKYVIKFDL